MWPFKNEEVKIEDVKIEDKTIYLQFLDKYFDYNDCMNFAIRRGIVLKYDVGQNITLIPRNITLIPRQLFYSLDVYRSARVTSIRHMRFCDIPNFTQWHLSTEKHDPLVVMMDIYGKEFSKKEIVTLIGFKVL